ncbi:hypothetical protein MMC30_003008 [Trapelia coarctata]|nr:hypothetical protein [Trapelia coarctata]
MSAESLAISRKGVSTDLRKLAKQHLEHDLNRDDRKTLERAASKLSTYITIGSLIGLGVGVALAWQIRSNRVKFFNAFKAMQRPTHVKFADGREEAVPDITPLIRPTKAGDIAAYGFFSVAGLFLGGETGLLTGAGSARRTISRDPAAKERIEKAFRAFRVDVLRKEIEMLEGGKKGSAIWPEA